MALPTNTTCDIYHDPNSPPADPDVAGVPCHLTADWRGGNEAGERGAGFGLANFMWTHVMLVALGTEIRDGYTGTGSAPGSTDRVYIPDKDGTEFKVAFVERVRGGGDHLRVYLHRQMPNWFTDDL
jgi:hypothetical protein